MRRMSEVHKARKILGVILGVLLFAGSMAGCGTAQAVTALAKTTTLPESGIVTEGQMKTLVGKTGTYSFKGTSGEYSYEWRYQADQVQNATEQKLKVDISEKGLDDVKKSAAAAPYALSVKIADFELAGSPKLIISLPTAWDANHVVVLASQEGELRQLSAAKPSISSVIDTSGTSSAADTTGTVGDADTADTAAATGSSGSSATSEKSTDAAAKATVSRLTATMTVTNRVVYFVAGATHNGSDDDASDGADTTDSADGADSSSTDDANDAKGADGTSAGSDAASSDSESSAVNDSTAGSAGSSSSAAGSAASGSHSGSSGSVGGASSSGNTFSVTFSIDAKTLLGHLNEVTAAKRSFVPANGWILAPTTVTATKGESVYDLLVAVTKAHGIQMEASYTPIYGSAYIEGINQLYEFDAGSLSGWMYSVDGWSSNYGASKYTALHNGSVVKWQYTRSLGGDI